MSPEPVNLDDYQNLVEDYHKESDRAAIVLAGSFVEHYLAVYLKHFMVQDDSTNALFTGFGPFGTFDQRISAAYAFRLIPEKTKKDLLLIKRIRDQFAHSPRALLLTDTSVQSRLSQLSTAREPGWGGEETRVLSPQTEGRLIYLFAVSRFVGVAHNTMTKRAQILDPQNEPTTP